MKTQDYINFRKKINKLAKDKRIPLHAMFELTYRCNFRCVHCYNTDEQKRTRPQDELKTKEVFNILRQLRDLGCFYIGFTGGEIFLRRDIIDILWQAKGLGFQAILLTNASFINEKIADELARLMPNKVDITLHAMNKNIFDRITQVPGSAGKVLTAINLLYNKNVPLGLKSCGMQENKSEIVKVNKFARKLNALYRFDGELVPRHDRSKIPLDYSVSMQEIYSLRRQCYPEMHTKYDQRGRLRKKTKLRKRNLERAFNCGAGYTDLAISPKGELKTCIEIDYPGYKILEGSLSEGWQKIRDFVDNLKPPKNWACLGCDLIKYCSWCPARGYLEDGNFFTCGSNTRQYAEFVKQLYSQNKR